jgi:uridylate kinase
LRFRRILLKLSGESLGDPAGKAIDVTRAGSIAEQVVRVTAKGVEVGIVIGAGNLWRGAGKTHLERTTSDHIGMLATVMNALALQSVLENRGVPTRVQSALSMDRVAEPYIRRRAMRHLEKKRVVIFAAGTGNPYFTTDSAAALRANEIGADVLLKATTVDGVYDRDPKLHPDAVRYSFVTYDEVMDKQLRVMDLTAISLCRENNLPVIVFGMDEPNSIENVVDGKPIGTYVGRTLPPEREGTDNSAGR